MKTGNLFKILLLIIFATTFVACESEEKDGDWEAMKWETLNVQIIKVFGLMLCLKAMNLFQ